MNNFLFPAPATPQADAWIICLPHAGGNLHTYHAWAAHLPPGVGLQAWQAPGRGHRIDASPLPDLAAMVDEVMAGLAKLEGAPYVLFGHSFGGLLAFETVRALRRAGRPLPGHFVASGCLPPPLTEARRLNYCGVDDDGAMFDRLAADGGVPAALLPHRSAFLPMMASVRAEYRVLSGYRCTADTPLAIPLSLFHAEHDRLVSGAEMAGWATLFAGPVDDVAFDGDHFYVEGAPTAAAASRRLGTLAAALLPAHAC